MNPQGQPSKVIYFSRGQHLESELRGAVPYRFHFVRTLKDFLLFFLENTDAMGLVAELDASDEENLSLVNLACRLNPLIPVLAFGSQASFETLVRRQKSKFIQWAPDLKSLAALLKPHSSKRKYCRVEWPLSVAYSPAFNMAGQRSGKVTSISIGGASVFTREITGLATGQSVYLKIFFEGFVFFVESRVVRVESGETPGFAVEFQKISPATRSALKELIDDQLVQLLTREFRLPEGVPAAKRRR